MELFDGLTAAELEQLAAVAVPRGFTKGEAIFHEGSAGDVLYVIGSGRVLIKRDHPGGRTIALAELERGAMFGELSVLDGEVRSASAECLESTKVYAITAGDMRRVLRNNPDMALKLIVSLTRKLRASTSRIGNQFFQRTEARIAAVILRLAKSRIGPDGEARLTVTATQAELAQLAGTSRETVNRFLAVLEREHVLTKRRGRLVLRDEEALRRFVT